MKVEKKSSISGQWAKANVDFADGHTITIKDGGQIVSGEYGDRYVFKVLTKNGERLLSFNQKSMNNLIDAFGDETSSWIDKVVRVFIIKAMVGGKLRNVVYLADVDWEMDDDGNFIKGSESENSEEEINSDEIPF